MRRLLVAAILTALAAPAYPQSMGMGIPMNQEKEVSPEVRAKRQATEEAYKSTMKGIPDANKPVDPWGNMRDTSSGNAAKGKSAKKSGAN